MTKALPLWVETLLNFFGKINQDDCLALIFDLIYFKPVLEAHDISEISEKYVSKKIYVGNSLEVCQNKK